MNKLEFFFGTFPLSTSIKLFQWFRSLPCNELDEILKASTALINDWAVFSTLWNPVDRRISKKR